MERTTFSGALALALILSYNGIAMAEGGGLLRGRKCFRGRRQAARFALNVLSIRLRANRSPSLPRKHLRPLATNFVNNPG